MSAWLILVCVWGGGSGRGGRDGRGFHMVHGVF
jgi:hypothetical protein